MIKQFARANRKLSLALCAILFLSQMGAANAAGATPREIGYHHAHHHRGHHHQRVLHGSGVRYNDGRPAAWCGWAMRHIVSSDPGPTFNLAANWAHYGTSAGGPGVGVIAVWPHHVAKIVGYDNASKRWITHEGNYRHTWHTGPRSLKGVIAFRNP